jgi:hypothetical protein
MVRLAPLVLMLLTACNQQPASQAEDPPSVPVSGNQSLKEIESDPAPPLVKNFEPDSAEAAVALLKKYHVLIGQKRYSEAWALWGHEGADSGMTGAEFAASLEKYASYHAKLGEPGGIDAGMMQRWIEIPVTVTGTLNDGSAFKLEGPMILHHIAQEMTDVTPEQKAWRIRESGLKPRP